MTVKICFVELNDERIIQAIKELKESVKVVGVGENETKPLEEIEYHHSENPLVTGLELLREGKVDGIIGGAVHSSKEYIKEALKIIGTKNGFASSFQILQNKGKKLLFADCGFNINPSAEELSKIAIQTALSAKKLGIEPRIAFLSYSTAGSAGGESVEKVRRAVKITAEKQPELMIEGELQVDAALREEVAIRKNPESKLKGKANILIFPNLDSGNIGYKLVKELGGWEGIGPFLQGFKKPIHDLSRGCSVKEIVDSALLMKEMINNK